jgi:PAS domain S-box-containing protein
MTERPRGDLGRARTDLSAQAAVARVLAEAQTLAEATPRLLEAIGKTLGWEVGALWTVDDRAGVMRCEMTWRTGAGAEGFERATAGRELALGEGFPGFVWSRGRPQWVPDFSDERFPRSQAAAEDGLGGAFGFLIRNRDRTLGVIEFFSREVRAPDERTLSLVETFGFQIGLYMSRKQAEDTVRENEALKGAMLESALDAIVTIDHRGDVVEFNPAAERIFGVRREDALGREMAALIIPPRLRDSHREALRRTVEGRKGELLGRRLELTGLRAGKEEFPVELTITRISVDGRPAFTGYLRDITDRLREQEREALLAEAAETLNASLEPSATLRALTEICVPAVGDYAVIDLLGEGRLVRRTIVTRAGEEREVRELEVTAAAPHGEQSRATTSVGREALHEQVSDALLEKIAHDERHLAEMRGTASRSAMLVPLQVRGRTLGRVAFLTAESGRRYGERDLALAREIARRAALAIDNARIHEERSRIAATLQASLLPPRLPRVPGLAVASRFRAVGEAYQVGGDFFDLFATGRDSWTLVIGDVSGKGPSAAAVTALARYTVREASAHEEQPSRVLARLNEAVLAYQAEGGEHFCTALLGRLRPGPAGVSLTLASGGHPLPFRLDALGNVEPVGAPGMLLGIDGSPDLSDAEIELAPGDSLLVYTDGVTETPIRGGMLGEEGLASLLAACRDLDAEALLEHIDTSVRGMQTGPPRDDVAMLAVRVEGTSADLSDIFSPPEGIPAL